MRAVIKSGGKQYIVSTGDQIKVDLIPDAKKSIDFIPLLVVDGAKTTVGTPEVSGVKVTAQVLEPDQMQDKVTSIRYKAKKRVRTVRGHRQHMTVLKIASIK